MMEACQICGNRYDPCNMADWGICYACKERELHSMGYVYVDNLGIGYSQQDIEEIGGISEIEKLNDEIR